MLNFTGSVDPDPQSAVWLGITYSIYIIIGIPANLLVLILTIAMESIHAVPLNVCIFCLAFADMMVLISFLSTPIWAMTYNVMVCKVMGVGIYVSVVMSMMLPSCLAVCRHVAICDDHELHPKLRALKSRKGIIMLNLAFWTYGILFPLPFIIADKFGLDGMGVCGIAEIDSPFLWGYYMVVIVGMLFAAYAVTFIFYRKLGMWIKATSSLMTMSSQTRETLMTTRSLMRMMKWLLFIPVIFYYPGLSIEAVIRLFPNAISVHTARYFMLTVPLPHVLDPIVTIVFIKSYRTAVINIVSGNAKVSASADGTRSTMRTTNNMKN